jgi:CHAT domain-containing protein
VHLTSLNPLPAVPVELSIVHRFWKGDIFLNQDFTLEDLKAQRTPLQPYGIVHLATHAAFESGTLSNSYIQLWNEKLGIDRLRELGWNTPPVELLVLSACQTAVGNNEAELGFGGMSVAAGVKTSLASLWSVSDRGTLALMAEFYQHLQTAPIKAEAIRQAQVAMLRGEVKVEDGQLVGEFGSIPISEELGNITSEEFSHPYFWSAFTLIGSPW